MATTTIVAGSAEKAATALQPLVTAGWFSSIVGDDTAYTLTFYGSGNNAQLTISNVNGNQPKVDFILADGTTYSYQFGGTSSTGTSGRKVRAVYTTASGAYIMFGNPNNVAAPTEGIIIAKTNNDAVGIVMLKSGRATVSALAVDDSGTEMADFAYAATSTRNQTVMCDVPTCSAANVPSYFSDVRYLFVSQTTYTDNFTTPPVNFTFNGEQWLWVGNWAIKDE